MFGITNICVLAALLVILALCVYYFIYTQKINRRVKSDGLTGKRLIDMPKMIMIAIILLSVSYCVFLSNALFEERSSHSLVSRNDYAIINATNPNNYQYTSYSGNDELRNAAFAEIYTKDENVGYTKEIIEDGGFVFTVFRRTSAADNFHPDFLCFVEYSGEKTDDLILYNQSGFTMSNGASHFSGGSSDWNLSDTLLFIGNVDEETTFLISMILLDQNGEDAFINAMKEASKNDEGYFPSEKDFAVASGQVEIWV